MKLKIFFTIFIISISSYLFPMKIDRVILAVNDNPQYIDFWPIVSKAWNNMGIIPTLALIGNVSVKVDESLGDVIRFEPIPGLSTITHAQCVRLLLPCYFEDDVCITADIDTLPLDPGYFFDSLKDIPDDKFVAFNKYMEGFPIQHMWYNVGKGKTFKDLFGVTHLDDIPYLLKHWYKMSTNLPVPQNYKYSEEIWRTKIVWTTDERMLSGYINHWKDRETRFVHLGHKAYERTAVLDDYDIQLLQSGYYLDVEFPKNYKANKEKIDQFLKKAGLENLIP